MLPVKTKVVHRRSPLDQVSQNISLSTASTVKEEGNPFYQNGI